MLKFSINNFFSKEQKKIVKENQESFGFFLFKKKHAIFKINKIN
jgi:hypothetical protein